jgi:hypothetical protein
MAANKIFLAPLGSGIGDVVVVLPALEWLINRGEAAVYLVARGPRQLGFESAIPGLAGVVREVDLDVQALAPDCGYINLRDHEVQRNYDWYGDRFQRDYPNFFINDILNLICRSFGIEADYSRFPRLLSTKRADVANKVAIVPGATCDFKALPASSWHAVCNALRARDIDFVVLGEPDRSPVVASLVADDAPYLTTPSIQDAIDVLSSVRGVISVDTGLMHIAVQQGTPTVAVFNQVHTYYREAVNCRAIFGPVCAPVCARQTQEKFPYPVDYKEWVWWDGAYDYCKSAEPCMTKISPTEVIAAFDQLLISIA